MLLNTPRVFRVSTGFVQISNRLTSKKRIGFFRTSASSPSEHIVILAFGGCPLGVLLATDAKFATENWGE